MKKFFLGILAFIVVIGLVACNNQKEEKITPSNNNDNNTSIATNDNKDIPQEIEQETTQESNDLTNEKMYDGIIDSYQKAMAEYDLEDVDADEKVEQKYPLVNLALLMHAARYSGDGVKLTYAFYDVNKDGMDELLVGVDNGCGAIYSYDKITNQPAKICFLSTIERGNLSIYDNGVIVTSGAGGAALHYYEFGKITKDTISYEVLESVEEEYVEEGKAPVYKNNETQEVLEYKSLTEINEKYISDAKIVDNINFIEM